MRHDPPQRFDLTLLDRYTTDTFITHEKHPLADLHIYGYYEDSGRPKVWDPVTRHCRGLILDGEGWVVERPYEKFFSFRQYIGEDLLLLNDNQVIRIPPGPFRITEKIDGTMTILYWIGDTPLLSTQRSFINPKAETATRLLHEKYLDRAKRLDRRYTWIFEAVYPNTAVLIDYGDTEELYLIGCIDKKTGRPVPVPDVGFPRCRDYTAEYGHITRLDELAALDLPNQEGFVLYYGDGTMVKVKFPWYSRAHTVLDRVVANEKSARRNYAELAALEGRGFPVLEKDSVKREVAAALKAGLSAEEARRLVKASVPGFYELLGLDRWLDRVLEGSGIAPGKGLPDGLFPAGDTFDFRERMREPQSYETTMWKWRERWLR